MSHGWLYAGACGYVTCHSCKDHRKKIIDAGGLDHIRRVIFSGPKPDTAGHGLKAVRLV